MYYEKDKDYQAEINKAVDNGDYEAAYRNEQARNEKIDALGLSANKTNNYAAYAPDRRGDYDYDTATGVGKKSYDYLGQSTTNKKPSAYASGYQSQIDSILNNLTNSKFSYNAESDPLYQQYAKTYNREGDRARQDTLGDVAANTGGLASSYATQAAQQAQNVYGAKLADKIPELQQLAYEMYNQDMSNQFNLLNAYQTQDNTGYGRYRDDVGDYQWQANMDNENYWNQYDRDYQKGRDAISDDFNNRQFQHTVDQDNFSNQYNMSGLTGTLTNSLANQYGYANGTKTMDASQNAFNNAYQMMAINGKVTNQQQADILGVPVGTTSLDYQTLQFQKYQYEDSKNFKGGSSGSGGSSIRKSSSKKSSKSSYKSSNSSKSSSSTSSAKSSSNAKGMQGYISSIGNRNGLSYNTSTGEADGWIAVPGYGRITVDRLERLIDQGKVKETKGSNGKIYYG